MDDDLDGDDIHLPTAAAVPDTQPADEDDNILQSVPQVTVSESTAANEAEEDIKPLTATTAHTAIAPEDPTPIIPIKVYSIILHSSRLSFSAVSSSILGARILSGM